MGEDLSQIRRSLGALDGAGIVGWGLARVFDESGRLVQAVPFANLITDYGDEFYIRSGARVSTPNPVSGIRLGTGLTAAAKNGAGAAIVTYVAGSAKAIDGGFPTAASKGAGAGWRATYQASWPAGVATANGISEAVITNETALTDVAGVAGNTLSRALLSSIVNKGPSDSLVITWQHDFLGA